MWESLGPLVSMYVFMLVPVWIPILGVVAGWVIDRTRPRGASASPARPAEPRTARVGAHRRELAIAE